MYACVHTCTLISVHMCTHIHMHMRVYTHREHNCRQEKFLESQENITNDFMPIDAKTWMKWIYLPEKQITKSNWSR